MGAFRLGTIDRRGRAPVALLWASNPRSNCQGNPQGNHGGIAPTPIGEPAKVKWTR